MRTYLAGAVALSILTGWTFACTAPTLSRLSPPSADPEPPDDDSEPSLDGGSEEEEDDSGKVSTESPAEALAAADCAQAFRCTARVARTQRGTPAQCEKEVLGIVNDVLATTDVTITDAQLLACADALTNSLCGDDVPKCAFKGPRTSGAACGTSEQCQTGYCGWQGSGAACPVCQTRPLPPTYAKENDSCAAATCAPGLGCRTSTKKCAPLSKVGEDCSDVPCDYDNGFACAKAGETERRCVAIAFSKLGGTCLYTPPSFTPPVLCEGSTCSTTASNTTGTCVAYLTKGSPCGTGPACGGGLVCTNGTCQPSIPDSCSD